MELVEDVDSGKIKGADMDNFRSELLLLVIKLSYLKEDKNG